MNIHIPQLKTAEWIEVLEPYQQELITTLLSENNEEEVMKLWIGVSGPEHTASFGGDGKNDYLKHFKKEFDKLILGEDSYKDVINEFNQHTTVTKFFVVSFLSNVMAENLGIASAVVAPLVVLALGTIGKIGLNAYRESIKINQN